MNSDGAHSHAGESLSRLLALLYSLLLIYGTLFPLHGWVPPASDPLQYLFRNGLVQTSWSDLVTNLLVYMPLGFLLVQGFPPTGRCRWCRWLGIVLAGTVLSLGLEYLQAYLPGRTPSARDLVLNAAGTGAGAALALLSRPSGQTGRRLYRLREIYFQPGTQANLGLMTLGLWAVAQLAPLAPSLDLDTLRHGLRPLIDFLRQERGFSWSLWGEYATALTALGILYLSLQRYRYLAISRFLVFAAAVLLLKIPVVGRQLAIEDLLGLLAAALLLPLVARARRTTGTAFASFLLLTSVVLEQLQPGTSVNPGHFNWVPFRGHLSNNLTGILDILGSVWPVLGLAYLVSRMGNRRRTVLAWGAAGIFFGSLALEWLQLRIPGRSPDITDTIVAVLVWMFAWIYLEKGSEARTSGPHPMPHLRRLPVVLAAATVAAVFIGGIFLPTPLETVPTAGARTLPAPGDLPPAQLPRFRVAHPRLPAPTAEDLARLERERPGYMRLRLKRARNGQGKLEDVIFGAYTTPGSQDLELLFERLMELKISWRGHQQAEPLALAYDWLYDQWSPEQRSRLAHRVVEASNYLIERIRVKQKLSPYNVYLYNRPFQALVATALASWKDLPEADPPMRWTFDYLKHRLLPVWRQIMGTGGGWHEGGEYVGIGIGKAIYRIPAMWRKATGEDLFASEPGIRGFADFLVYRTRPDGTAMRWGDGRFFGDKVADRAALAMETDHKAAYSLRCPKSGVPTSWPWGPLADDAYCDPQAVERLPLEKLFDGLGLLVVRSDWGRDATYATFKAGDNFWSHTHLDQGAFTLFKGGPLAIDSGYYGPGYSADHRFNYSAQSIAHNVITVTDPNDSLAMPARGRNGKPRPIANDGGQRRVGSGWGEPAPLDISDWKEKQDIYHTGRIARYFANHDLVVAVAEITPAYTNQQSGKGTFAHRTFRVRRYWRTFIYDRRNDLVLIHDDVVSADPAFRKRSLVHTITEPLLREGGFEVNVPAITPPGKPVRPAGHLRGRVLFPRNARITKIGGRGREFWVDGRNYDAGGEIWKKIAEFKGVAPEPGRWRVEISPAVPRERDRFLLALMPGQRKQFPVIEPLESSTEIGARISSPQRHLEIRFPTDREGVLVKIDDPDGKHTIDLTLPQAPLLPFPKGRGGLPDWLK